MLVLEFKVTSGGIPGFGVDWTFTVIDEAGNTYGSAISTEAWESAADGSTQISEFGRVFSVPEQTNSLTLDIDGAVQVDITPALTTE